MEKKDNYMIQSLIVFWKWLWLDNHTAEDHAQMVKATPGVLIWLLIAVVTIPIFIEIIGWFLE